jgi:hypothetical protein
MFILIIIKYMTSEYVKSQLVDDEFYKKYEQFGLKFIIDRNHLNGIQSDDLDEFIRDTCYFRLSCLHGTPLAVAIKENLIRAQTRGDQQYMDYIINQYQIIAGSVSIEASLKDWTYQPPKRIREKKLKLAIKPELIANNKGLSDLLNQQKIKDIHAYIWTHKLQDRVNRKYIHPNAELQAKLKPLESSEMSYTYFNLPRYIL